MSLQGLAERVQGHMARKEQRRDLNPGLCDPKAALSSVLGSPPQVAGMGSMTLFVLQELPSLQQGRAVRTEEMMVLWVSPSTCRLDSP